MHQVPDKKRELLRAGSEDEGSENPMGGTELMRLI